jgi:hypothetical protein
VLLTEAPAGRQSFIDTPLLPATVRLIPRRSPSLRLVRLTSIRCRIGPARRSARGRARRPVGGRPVTLWVGGLAHLDQMTVGIADVAALLVLVLFWRRQELSTPAAPLGVHGVNVFDPDIQEAADRSGSRGVSRVTVGLSSVGPPPTLMTIQLLASAT